MKVKGVITRISGKNITFELFSDDSVTLPVNNRNIIDEALLFMANQSVVVFWVECGEIYQVIKYDMNTHKDVA